MLIVTGKITEISNETSLIIFRDLSSYKPSHEKLDERYTYDVIFERCNENEKHWQFNDWEVTYASNYQHSVCKNCGKFGRHVNDEDEYSYTCHGETIPTCEVIRRLNRMVASFYQGRFGYSTDEHDFIILAETHSLSSVTHELGNPFVGKNCFEKDEYFSFENHGFYTVVSGPSEQELHPFRITAKMREDGHVYREYHEATEEELQNMWYIRVYANEKIYYINNQTGRWRCEEISDAEYLKKKHECADCVRTFKLPMLEKVETEAEEWE